MATFISTVKFTERGISDIKHTCQRAKNFESSAQKMGVEIDDIFWTDGPFDGLIVFNAPDDQTAAALMLRLSAAGYVQSQTSRAYRAEEMESIVKLMSS